MISAFVMRHGIMTEKLARRGVRVPAEYHADHLDQVLVRDYAARDVASFGARQTVRTMDGSPELGGDFKNHCIRPGPAHTCSCLIYFETPPGLAPCGLHGEPA
ncbi:MAG: hypothetical protein ABSH53_20015 [Holophaga sp.]|jgi:hypothetical protein